MSSESTLARSSVTFVSYGARIAIQLDDPALKERVRAFLPPNARRMGSAEPDAEYTLKYSASNGRRAKRYRLILDGELLARHRELAPVLEFLRGDLHFRVALHARRRLFVHAGVVGWRNRAILIPGRTHTGKSTLTAALVRAGATYYSDEFAVIDAEGLVHPYPRLVALRDRPYGPLTRVTAETLGGEVGTTPLRVGLVALCTYRRRARWRPVELTPGEAALALLDNTVLARIRPKFALPRLANAVAHARAVRTARGAADVTARRVLRELDRGLKR